MIFFFLIFWFFFLATAFSSTWPHYISPGGYCQIIPCLNSVSLYWYNRKRERKTGTMYLYLSDSLLLYLHLSFLPCRTDGFCQNSPHTLSVPELREITLRVTFPVWFRHHLPLSLSLLPLPSSPCCCSALNMTKERTKQTKVERALKSSNWATITVKHLPLVYCRREYKKRHVTKVNKSFFICLLQIKRKEKLALAYIKSLLPPQTLAFDFKTAKMKGHTILLTNSFWALSLLI